MWRSLLFKNMYNFVKTDHVLTDFRSKLCVYLPIFPEKSDVSNYESVVLKILNLILLT